MLVTGFSERNNIYRMNKIILVSGHPSPEGSTVNKIISSELEKTAGVTVRCLNDSRIY
jgi:hypothetical protein